MADFNLEHVRSEARKLSIPYDVIHRSVEREKATLIVFIGRHSIFRFLIADSLCDKLSTSFIERQWQGKK